MQDISMSQACPHCDCDPCLWEEFREEIKGNAEVLAAIDQSQPRNEIRKQAYRAYEVMKCRTMRKTIVALK
jgi:hypothetical protein